MPKIALVTGANRGLGKGCARTLAEKGYVVYVAGRNRAAVKAVTEELISDFGAQAYPLELDVASDESVAKAVAQFSHSELDLLVNNAGVMLDAENTVADVTPKVLMDTFDINTVGVIRTTQAFLPFLKESSSARVVNVSSGLGQLSEMGTGYPAYRLSKTALNAWTRTMASTLEGSKIKVNAVCPGWVKTDMGGPNAARDLQQGVDSILWAAFIDDNGPSGGFFRDGEVVDW